MLKMVDVLVFGAEVEFYQRKHNAVRAYTEWMPIRYLSPRFSGRLF